MMMKTAVSPFVSSFSELDKFMRCLLIINSLVSPRWGMTISFAYIVQYAEDDDAMYLGFRQLWHYILLFYIKIPSNPINRYHCLPPLQSLHCLHCTHCSHCLHSLDCYWQEKIIQLMFAWGRRNIVCMSWSPGVKFVTAVTAGGSVKFLPAV